MPPTSINPRRSIAPYAISWCRSTDRLFERPPLGPVRLRKLRTYNWRPRAALLGSIYRTMKGAKLMHKLWWALILLTAWIGGAVSADDDCSNASPNEAKALALKAAAQLETLGKEQAFRNFMDPDGEFFPRDLYVIVVDLDGIMWVNGAYPQGMGT